MAKKDSDEQDLYEDVLEDRDKKLHVPKELPILMLRDIVVFPYMVIDATFDCLQFFAYEEEAQVMISRGNNPFRHIGQLLK